MKYEKLYELRKKNNYTHKQMAEFLKISKPYYCQLENNKRTLTYIMSYKISKIFNMKPDDIFYDTVNKKS